MYELNFVNAVSPVMGEFMVFHDVAIYVLMVMMILVGGVFYLMLSKNFLSFSFLEFSFLEIIWTMMPGFILFFLAIPSLKLLYYMEISGYMKPDYTIKVTGYQWYWSYKYNYKDDLGTLEYDSYMLKSSLYDFGDLRLLEVDNPLFVPANGFYRFMIGSGDVIHSFTVKGLGLKVDAVPGRLNLGYFYSWLYGSFYGQCSEICGVNHSFMPMKLEVMKL